jgi:hypothetical protein
MRLSAAHSIGVAAWEYSSTFCGLGGLRASLVLEDLLQDIWAVCASA